MRKTKILIFEEVISLTISTSCKLQKIKSFKLNETLFYYKFVKFTNNKINKNDIKILKNLKSKSKSKIKFKLKK